MCINQNEWWTKSLSIMTDSKNQLYSLVAWFWTKLKWNKVQQQVKKVEWFHWSLLMCLIEQIEIDQDNWWHVYMVNDMKCGEHNRIYVKAIKDKSG